MTWEKPAGDVVHTHYGARKVGGGIGHNPTAGQQREIKIDFNGDLHAGMKIVIPGGAQVIDYKEYAVTGTATVKAGNTAIKTAKIADDSTYIAIASDSVVTYTGATAGYAVVTYRFM